MNAITILLLVCLAIVGVAGALFAAWRSKTRALHANHGEVSTTRRKHVDLLSNETAVPVRAAILPIGGDLAVAFGAEVDLPQIGTSIESLSGPVAKSLAISNVAIQAIDGVKAANAGGQIVRLIPEFVEAAKAGKVTTDAAGVVLGLARDASGQITQIARYTEVAGTAAVSVANVGMSVALLAIQIQLQQMSKQLGRIEGAVADIAEHLDDELVASVKSNTDALLQAGRKFQATGTIDDDEWIKLALYDKSLRQNVLQLEAKLGRILDSLEKVPGKNRHRDAASRVEALAEVSRGKPRLWLQLYFEAQRAVVMYEQLQVFRRLSTNSPDLGVHKSDAIENSRAAVERLFATLRRADRALKAAGKGNTEHGFWDYVPGVKHPFMTSFYLDEQDTHLRKYIRDERAALKPMIESVWPVHKMIGQLDPAEPPPLGEVGSAD